MTALLTARMDARAIKHNVNTNHMVCVTIELTHSYPSTGPNLPPITRTLCARITCAVDFLPLRQAMRTLVPTDAGGCICEIQECMARFQAG